MGAVAPDQADRACRGREQRTPPVTNCELVIWRVGDLRLTNSPIHQLAHLPCSPCARLSPTDAAPFTGRARTIMATVHPAPTGLPRRLGLWSSVALVVGIAIGSGIFRSPAG